MMLIQVHATNTQPKQTQHPPNCKKNSNKVDKFRSFRLTFITVVFFVSSPLALCNIFYFYLCCLAICLIVIQSVTDDMLAKTNVADTY